jgi:alpha-1,2-mannosyltransferase
MGRPATRQQAQSMNSVIARPQRQRPPGRIQPQRLIQLHLPRGRRARRATAIVLLIELGLVAGFAAVYRPFDLSIYLWGGHAVTHGLTLYLQQARANWFTYPPFAAALFTPLAVLPGVVVSLAWELGSVAAFAWACLLTLRLAGRNPSGPVLAATVAAGLLLEPVYHTLFLGQVNIFLLALVLTDVWLVSRGRPGGIGIGLAAAIKLTPAIFIVLLLLTRRTRDAAIAGGMFAVCAVTGFLVDPGASRLYWLHLCYDTSRVRATYISNQSPYGALTRVLGGASHVGSWYLLIPLVLGALGLAVGTTLGRRGDWLGAAAATGITSLLVCPISWTHHWVWALPALVVMLRGGTAARIAAACGYALFVLAPMWWVPRSAQNTEYGLHGLATLNASCFLIAGIAFLGYLAVVAARPRPAAPSRAVTPRAHVPALVEL